MLRTLVLMVLVMELATSARAQSLWLIDPLPLANRTQVDGLSRDGTRLVGNHWNNGTGYARGFGWSPLDGREDWGLSLPEPNRWLASGVSGDGSSQIGNYDGFNGIELFRRRDGVVQLLGAPAASTGLVPTGADDCADAISGYSDEFGTNRAFRWTVGGGFEYIDTTFQFGLTRATAISADGDTVVGYGLNGFDSAAFRWTPEGGMLTFPGAYFADVSSEGRFVTGYFNTLGGPRAMLWNEANEPRDLGLVAGSNWTYAEAVSADGKVVVGVGRVPGANAPTIPWIWSEQLSIVPLEGYLAERGVMLPEGWRLHDASHISDDGLTIAGVARHATLGERVFVATIPTPSAAMLGGIAMCAVARRRRRAE